MFKYFSFLGLTALAVNVENPYETDDIFYVNGVKINLKGRAFLIDASLKPAKKYKQVNAELLNGGYWTIIQHAYAKFDGLRASKRYSSDKICVGDNWMIQNALTDNSSAGTAKFQKVKGKQPFAQYCDSTGCHLDSEFREELQFTHAPEGECADSHIWVTNKWFDILNDAIITVPEIIDVEDETEPVVNVPTVEPTISKGCGELIPLTKSQAWCPDTCSVCNKAIKTYREYHMSFDLQLSQLNSGNWWRQIIHLGDSATERLPAIWAWAAEPQKFYISFSNSNERNYKQEQGFDSGSGEGITVLDHSDLQPHNWDIKVWAKDPNCTGKNCDAQAEFKFDGVSLGVNDIGPRLNDLEEDTVFWIGSPWAAPYPGATISNILYERYSG